MNTDHISSLPAAVQAQVQATIAKAKAEFPAIAQRHQLDWRSQPCVHVVKHDDGSCSVDWSVQRFGTAPGRTLKIDGASALVVWNQYFEGAEYVAGNQTVVA